VNTFFNFFFFKASPQAKLHPKVFIFLWALEDIFLLASLIPKIYDFVVVLVSNRWAVGSIES
jgi:hypothetical protein